MSLRSRGKTDRSLLRHCWAVLLALAATQAAMARAGDADAFNRRCAVCHMTNGAGVPGAFPPLGSQIPALAASAAGRDYLVAVLTYGRAGGLSVDGTTYNGVMPPQALSDNEAVEILNYVLDSLNTRAADGRLFSPEEFAEIRQRIAVRDINGTSSLRPNLP
jgi:mono/diheme cytochrome c family protein